MKKILLLALLLLFALAACSGLESDYLDYFAVTAAPAAENAILVEDEADWAMQRAVTAESDSVADAPASPAATSAQRMIYRASAEIRTTVFDDTTAQINQLIGTHNAFIQDSHISGNTERHRNSHTPFGRSASFSIRVPAVSYRDMLDAIAAIEGLDHLNQTATNVTGEYTDIAARLTALRTQEERILALLENAANLSDILELESRLSELTFRIERYTTRRNDLSQQIAYSTIDVWVEELLEENAASLSGGIGNTFLSSLQAMQTAGIGFLHFLAAFSPWLIVFGGIAISVIAIVRATKKRRLSRKERAEQAKSEG